jgi:hypothetical protein
MSLDTGPEAAIVAHLVRRPAATSTSQPRTGGWTSSTACGGPGADPATIVFQRTRMLPSCQMRQVGFFNHRGIPEEWVIRTWQEPDGTWAVAPCGGGSPGPSRRAKPWINFTAGFGANGFSAGGNIVGTGSEHAHSVRLTFADGNTIDDTVENRIVLFFEPIPVAFPADVEILDENGRRLANYKEFDGFPFVT